MSSSADVAADHASDGGADGRFLALGPDLGRASAPLARYVAAVESRGLVFLAGHGPIDGDGSPKVVGTLGRDIGVDDAVLAARLTATNLLTSLREAIGSLDRVAAICQIRGYLRSAPGFGQDDEVMAAVTAVFAQVFGERVAVAAPTISPISECVLGLPVTVDAIVALRPAHNRT